MPGVRGIRVGRGRTAVRRRWSWKPARSMPARCRPAPGWRSSTGGESGIRSRGSGPGWMRRQVTCRPLTRVDPWSWRGKGICARSGFPWTAFERVVIGGPSEEQPSIEPVEIAGEAAGSGSARKGRAVRQGDSSMRIGDGGRGRTRQCGFSERWVRVLLGGVFGAYAGLGVGSILGGRQWNQDQNCGAIGVEQGAAAASLVLGTAGLYRRDSSRRESGRIQATRFMSLPWGAVPRDWSGSLQRWSAI